jgi:hypothetical protein
MRKRALLGVFLAVLALSAPAAAQTYTAPAAQTPYSRDYGAHSYGAVQPLDRILPAIREGRPGRFYDAEGPFSSPDGGLHYRIKWLTPEGRIVWLDADARTGHVMGAFRGYAPGMPPSGLRYWGRPRFGGRPFGPRGWGRAGLGWGPRHGH